MIKRFAVIRLHSETLFFFILDIEKQIVSCIIRMIGFIYITDVLLKVIYMKKIVFLLSGSLILLTIVYFVFSDREAASFSIASDRIDISKTILLDPGHGGFDGGATAANGTPEKEFNLQIALKLRDLLELYGFHVVMTRTQDVGTEDPAAGSIREKKVTDIRNRMSMLNEQNDRILISIHQNYFTDASCSGTQVFYSPNDPQSKPIAQAIQAKICGDLQRENTRMIKAAGNDIYLMHHAQRPAVLVECGFISNPAETALLCDDDYQKKLAFCIANALFEYFCVQEEPYGAENQNCLCLSKMRS